MAYSALMVRWSTCSMNLAILPSRMICSWPLAQAICSPALRAPKRLSSTLPARHAGAGLVEAAAVYEGTKSMG